MATSTPRSPLRRLLGVLSSVLVAGFLVAGFAGTAHAVDGYRYWNYFHLKADTWAFSQVGASDYQPKDGDVEGYRFATSTTAKGVAPRADLSEVNFGTICASAQAVAGQKRVAVVVDYGTEADADGTTPPAPLGECAVVQPNANGQDVLQVVADVRVEKGLTCALDGYPAKGCGDAVPDAPPPATEQTVAFDLPNDDSASTDSGVPSGGDDSTVWGPLLGICIAAIGIAGVGLSLGHRKRTATRR